MNPVRSPRWVFCLIFANLTLYWVTALLKGVPQFGTRLILLASGNFFSALILYSFSLWPNTLRLIPERKPTRNEILLIALRSATYVLIYSLFLKFPITVSELLIAQALSPYFASVYQKKREGVPLFSTHELLSMLILFALTLGELTIKKASPNQMLVVFAVTVLFSINQSIGITLSRQSPPLTTLRYYGFFSGLGLIALTGLISPVPHWTQMGSIDLFIFIAILILSTQLFFIFGIKHTPLQLVSPGMASMVPISIAMMIFRESITYPNLALAVLSGCYLWLISKKGWVKTDLPN